MSSKSGFTLIELLISITIIGILAVAGIQTYKVTLLRGRDTKRLDDMQTLKTALSLYYQINKTYPTPNSACQGVGSWEVSYLNGQNGCVFLNALQPYLSGLPLDPVNKVIANIDLFATRPDGSYFYSYYFYSSLTAGSSYGCSWTGPFAVLGFRSAEAIDRSTLPKAQCGPQPCPRGGTPNVCRDWSTELDYSVFLKL